MKISDITLQIVKDFCGISDNDSDEIIKNLMIPSAKSFITSYTGLSSENLDKYEEFAFAMLILVNDMYSNREYTLNVNRQVNPAVKTLLGMHSVNYL